MFFTKELKGTLKLITKNFVTVVQDCGVNMVWSHYGDTYSLLYFSYIDVEIYQLT